MFTINQIKEAHLKVKSGADFPKYVQDIKALGVLRYEHFVSDGHITYSGQEGVTLSADAKWQTRAIAAKSDTGQLKHFLAIHQQGQTSYATFCEQCAGAGVEKWVVDLVGMTCIYYDLAGNEMVVETIPAP